MLPLMRLGQARPASPPTSPRPRRPGPRRPPRPSSPRPISRTTRARELDGSPAARQTRAAMPRASPQPPMPAPARPRPKPTSRRAWWPYPRGFPTCCTGRTPPRRTPPRPRGSKAFVRRPSPRLAPFRPRSLWPRPSRPWPRPPRPWQRPPSPRPGRLRRLWRSRRPCAPPPLSFPPPPRAFPPRPQPLTAPRPPSPPPAWPSPPPAWSSPPPAWPSPPLPRPPPPPRLPLPLPPLPRPSRRGAAPQSHRWTSRARTPAARGRFCATEPFPSWFWSSLRTLAQRTGGSAPPAPANASTFRGARRRRGAGAGPRHCPQKR
mmetsp:Transcript_100062/g.287473  ORF Transcript_100062/g.287473 Transcript_100062/m.287473 type:complete len:319 (+) Transcript_100062:1844-2800(+)